MAVLPLACAAAHGSVMGMRQTSLTHIPRHAALVAAALLVVYLVWGSTYVSIRIAIDTVPPFMMAGSRFLIAGTLLYAWCARRRRVDPGTWRPPTALQWRTCLMIGLALLVGANGGVTWAEQHVPSGVAALLIATVPLWMAVFVRIVDREPFSLRGTLGLVLGLVGVALLVNPFAGGAFHLGGSLVVLTSALLWAGGSIYARNAPTPEQPLLGAAMEMVCAGVVLIVLSGLTGEFGRLQLAEVSGASVLAVAYLVVFGSLLAYSSYEWLLHNAPSRLVGTYAYVNPLVAVLLGWVLLDEAITSRSLAAAAVILAGVALLVSRSRRPVADPPLEPQPRNPVSASASAL